LTVEGSVEARGKLFNAQHKRRRRAGLPIVLGCAGEREALAGFVRMLFPLSPKQETEHAEKDDADEASRYYASYETF
jgi:hypothetical protein